MSKGGKQKRFGASVRDDERAETTPTERPEATLAPKPEPATEPARVRVDAPAKASGSYVVAPGRSIATRVGRLDAGAKITADHLHGGEETLQALEKKGAVRRG